jgi:hypothetical protein
MGALDLGIKLDTFLHTPIKVDVPIGLRVVFVNTNDCGSHTWR